MAYNMTCRLHSITPSFRRILRQNQCSYPVKKMIPSRELSSILPSKYHEVKYGELKNRLAEVPYSNLVDKEADRVLRDSCYENDDGLEDVLNWYSKLIASINLTDDIVDNSILRNGEPCWYKKTDVGLVAVNDSKLLQSGIYKLLEKHFSNSKCYMNLVHEFLKVSREAAYGQCMAERFNSRNRNQGFAKITFELYQTHSKYNFAPLGVSLPVLLGMHLAGGCTAKEYDFAKKLCLKLGLYCQCQDDYSDSFGSNELKFSGMMGNDIREGNFTWFSVKFLEEASEPMKKQFLENYGVDDNNAVANVLELYRKANLSEKFEEFDEQLYAEISTLIESMNDVRGYLFYDLFADIRKNYR